MVLMSKCQHVLACSLRIQTFPCSVAVTKVHLQVHEVTVLACEVTRFISDLLCKSRREDHGRNAGTKGRRL